MLDERAARLKTVLDERGTMGAEKGADWIFHAI